MKAKKEKGPNLEEVERLDGAIAAEERTIKGLEAKVEKALGDKARAEQAQQENAYVALSTEDAGTARKLEAAEETLAKVGQRVRSSEIALATAREKKRALEDSRAEAFREANGREADLEEGELRSGECEDLEKLLAEVAKAREAAFRRIDRIKTLAWNAGRDAARYDPLKKDIDLCIQQRTPNPPPIGHFDSPRDNYYRYRSVPEVLWRHAQQPEKEEAA